MDRRKQQKLHAKSLSVEDRRAEDMKFEAFQKEQEFKRLEKIKQQRDYLNEMSAQIASTKQVHR